jgi:hypothetical protein
MRFVKKEAVCLAEIWDDESDEERMEDYLSNIVLGGSDETTEEKT